MVCLGACWWWREVGEMSGEPGGPLYHIWLYLCVFGWVCLVVCWWWPEVGDMIGEPGGPLYHIWLWLGMFGCMLVLAWAKKYD